MGQGYAVRRLREASFLEDKRILYWGDLDAHGFEILAILRREFPHTQSVMMDQCTWERFAGYRVQGVKSRSDAQTFLAHLTEEEAVLFGQISQAETRLEQERIPQAYVSAELGDKYGA